MQIEFQPKAKEDLDYWVKTGNKSILKKMTELIKAINENPFDGIGKPEQLKYALKNNWSRRINSEHRLVY